MNGVAATADAEPEAVDAGVIAEDGHESSATDVDRAEAIAAVGLGRVVGEDETVECERRASRVVELDEVRSFAADLVQDDGARAARCIRRSVAAVFWFCVGGRIVPAGLDIDAGVRRYVACGVDVRVAGHVGVGVEGRVAAVGVEYIDTDVCGRVVHVSCGRRTGTGASGATGLGARGRETGEDGEEENGSPGRLRAG